MKPADKNRWHSPGKPWFLPEINFYRKRNKRQNTGGESRASERLEGPVCRLLPRVVHGPATRHGATKPSEMPGCVGRSGYAPTEPPPPQRHGHGSTGGVLHLGLATECHDGCLRSQRPDRPRRTLDEVEGAALGTAASSRLLPRVGDCPYLGSLKTRHLQTKISGLSFFKKTNRRRRVRATKIWHVECSSGTSPDSKNVEGFLLNSIRDI